MNYILSRVKILINIKKGPVNVIISNAFYERNFTANIFKVSSFKNIRFIKDNSISLKGNNRTISLSYDSLGEPSCTIVWLTVGSVSTKSVAFGTSYSYCSISYSSVVFTNVYNKTNASISFNMIMSLSGIGNVNFLIKNDLESLKLTTTVTVSNLNCKRPILEIQNRVSDFLNPMLINRSKKFSVVGITTLDCEATLKNIKQWFVYEINPNTGLNHRTVNLTDIITSFSTEIYIPSNFFGYGTYRFILQVSMDGDANAFVDSVDTFIKIVPSGMTIFPFSGGIKDISIGTGQSVNLDPGKYSIDLDGLLVGTELTYKYFCRMIIDGEAKEFPNDYYQHFIDLQRIKDAKISIQTVQSNICFQSPGFPNTIKPNET